VGAMEAEKGATRAPGTLGDKTGERWPVQNSSNNIRIWEGTPSELFSTGQKKLAN